MGPSQWIIESKTTYRPSRTWTFVANFWLRGDLSTEFTSYNSAGGGIIDPTPVVDGSGAYPGFTFPNTVPLKLNNCNGNVMQALKKKMILKFSYRAYAAHGY